MRLAATVFTASTRPRWILGAHARSRTVHVGTPRDRDASPRDGAPEELSCLNGNGLWSRGSNWRLWQQAASKRILTNRTMIDGCTHTTRRQGSAPRLLGGQAGPVFLEESSTAGRGFQNPLDAQADEVQIGERRAGPGRRAVEHQGSDWGPRRDRSRAEDKKQRSSRSILGNPSHVKPIPWIYTPHPSISSHREPSENPCVSDARTYPHRAAIPPSGSEFPAPFTHTVVYTTRGGAPRDAYRSIQKEVSAPS